MEKSIGNCEIITGQRNCALDLVIEKRFKEKSPKSWI